MTLRRKPAPSPPVVSSDACPRCGTGMRSHRGRLSLRVNSETTSVPDAAHARCPKCREVVLRLDEARLLQETALDIYRTRHGLLCGSEIRAMRRRAGLTQSELALLLRLGGNTLSRWESGRNVQTAAMDVLLRLVRDVPATLTYLRDHPA